MTTDFYALPQRWLISAVLCIAFAPGFASGQSTGVFEDERHDRFEPIWAETSSPSESESDSDSAGRFTDARPITPSGRQAASGSGGERTGATGGPSAWKTFGALAAIVGVIVFGGRLWKKHGPAIAGGLPAEAIEVLGRRSLDARQAIHLVRLGSRILVLGSTTAGLRTLAEVTDPVEVDYLAGLCRRRDADQSVAHSFRALFGGRAIAESADDAVVPTGRSADTDFSGADQHRSDTQSHAHSLPGGANV